jgi:hypothetical protein
MSQVCIAVSWESDNASCIDTDVLRLPGAVAVDECGEDPLRRLDTRRDVRLPAGVHRRRAVRVAGEREHTTHRQGDQVRRKVVRVRPPAPERGDRAVNQPRIELAQLGFVRQQAPGLGRREALHQHVGRRQQPPKDRLPVLRREVEGEAALARVVVPEVERAILVRLVVEGRRRTRRRAGRRLDPDHVRAKVRQQLRRVLAELTREVQHTNVVQRGRGRAPVRHSHHL